MTCQVHATDACRSHSLGLVLSLLLQSAEAGSLGLGLVGNLKLLLGPLLLLLQVHKTCQPKDLQTIASCIASWKTVLAKDFAACTPLVDSAVELTAVLLCREHAEQVDTMTL